MLVRGIASQEVKELHEQLSSLNVYHSDGDTFGLLTEAAVISLQRYMGLAPDGIVGPKTLMGLRALKPFPEPYDPIYVFRDVKYFSQRDNLHRPSGTCNVTTVAMLLNYMDPTIKDQFPGQQLEDALYEILMEKEAQEFYARNFPDLYSKGFRINTVHGMLGWLIKHFGYHWKWVATRPQTWGEEIKEYNPIIVPGKFTRSGHIVLLIGATIDGDFIVHDPWGDWNTGYRNRNGAFRIYRKERIPLRYTKQGTVYHHLAW